MCSIQSWVTACSPPEDVGVMVVMRTKENNSLGFPVFAFIPKF